jgi:predicted transcriptional regulator
MQRHLQARIARKSRGTRTVGVNQTFVSAVAAYIDRENDRLDRLEESMATARTLVKDGKWAVPVEDRPRGWKEMGISE